MKKLSLILNESSMNVQQTFTLTEVTACIIDKIHKNIQWSFFALKN